MRVTRTALRRLPPSCDLPHPHRRRCDSDGTRGFLNVLGKTRNEEDVDVWLIGVVEKRLKSAHWTAIDAMSQILEKFITRIDLDGIQRWLRIHVAELPSI